jgi:anthranilate 1,2-dioxygenase small subunit
MTTTTVHSNIRIEQARNLLCDYTHVLNDGRLIEWPEFFTDKCLYRVTTRQIEQNNQALSIMFCDSRAMLFDRVEATEKANIYEPHNYRHVLSDSKVLDASGDELTLQTNFVCVRTMLNGDMMLFAAGKYVDEIVQDGERCRFRSKTVVLDQSNIDTLIAIPL